MQMFATHYDIEIKCGVCKLPQLNKSVACFYTNEDTGYYFEMYLCFNCLETIHDEVKKHEIKSRSNTRG